MTSPIVCLPLLPLSHGGRCHIAAQVRGWWESNQQPHPTNSIIPQTAPSSQIPSEINIYTRSCYWPSALSFLKGWACDYSLPHPGKGLSAIPLENYSYLNTSWLLSWDSEKELFTFCLLSWEEGHILWGFLILFSVLFSPLLPLLSFHAEYQERHRQ